MRNLGEIGPSIVTPIEYTNLGKDIHMSDNINPNHYKTQPVECWEFTKYMGFALGNSFKYVWRYKHKNGVEDLRKALWYLVKLKSEKGYLPAIIEHDTFKLMEDKLNLCLFTGSQYQALRNLCLAQSGIDQESSLDTAFRSISELLNYESAENGS